LDDFGKLTDEVTNLILPLDAFVRSVRVNRSSPHAFFLGAGCSISSGVPSAEMCIWRWKQDIFATANPGLVEQLGDTSLASVRERIQTWLNAEGRFPKQGSSEEYSFYVEQCYPIGSDRRRFFQELAQAAQPYLGYDLLCLLAEAGLISHVWTTNFDGLTARAAATSALSVIEVGLDTTDRIVRPPARNELLCVALHGDYRYDALKNTDQEVQEQDAKLREALIENLSNTSLIVAGYAGRDMSIMAALAEAYSRPGTGRLYWCGRDGSEPSDEVLSLLQKARKAGRQAYYVPITGFDDLITRMAFHCLAGAPQKRAAEIAAKNSLSAARRAPFTLDVNDVQSVIKSNAFSIQCPTEVLQFEVDGLPGPGAWKQLKEAIRGHEIAAVLHRGKVLALGTVDDVRASFGTRIKGDVERTPISNKELSFENGMIVSLLTEGLVRSIAATRDVETDNRRRLWTPSFHERTFLGQRCRVHDAVLVYLRQYNGKQYVVLKPTIRVTDIEGQEVDEKLEREAKRALLVRQYNREFNSALDAWRKRLFPADRGEFEYPPKSGMPFRFIVRKSPAFAQVGSSSRSGGIRLQPEVSRHVVYSGMQYEEPSLLFSDQQGVSHVKDTHPIRGILQNRPYDFGLTTRRFAASVRIGVICPKPDESKLAVYLATLYRRARADSKQEYLLDYPGFGKAFGISLELPQPGDSEWMRCGEPSPETGKMKGALDLGRHIIESIDALRASSQPNVMVVYIPRRWEEWNGYRTETERFDLHRFVKAYCVQRGITTQFLREETLSKPGSTEDLLILTP
jgi:NAD-dependent SIR2 family protein deacetylase